MFSLRALKSTFTPKNTLLIGQCLAHEIPKEAKVRIIIQEFDSYLNMYFSKYHDFIVHDKNQICKSGDTVLIKSLLENQQTKTHINHNIVKILYPVGDVTDPVTGKKCVRRKYREIMKFEKEIYGKAEEAASEFDYDSAPERGWQEGKKDFHHRVGYFKFHDFPEGHPKHNDPAAS